MVFAANVLHQRGDRDGTLEWLRRAVAHGYGAEVLEGSAEFHDLREDAAFRSMMEQSKARRNPGSTAHGGATREEST